jgi:hypothetical protein
MRKVPFILFGLLTIAVLLFALKFFALIYTPLPKVEQQRYKKTDVAQLIDNLMWEDNGSRAKIYWTDLMERLVKMGEPVVPDLIKAVETAHEKAAAGTHAGDRPSAWRINYDTEMLQTRAAMVLGKIGDARALSVLKSLKPANNILMRSYVDEAIESIQENEKRR